MDLPPQDVFAFDDDTSSEWLTSQQDGFAFQVPDNTTQESWTEFMSWDPDTSQSQSGHPQSSPDEDSAGPTRPLHDRRSTQIAPSSFNLEPERQRASAIRANPMAAIPFGDEAIGSTSFDFDLDGLTYVPGVQDYSHVVNVNPRPENLTQTGRLGSLTFSTVDRSMHGTSGNGLSASSVSSRASLDHSPNSLTDSHATPPSSSGSPEPHKANNRKRKSADLSTENEVRAKRGSKQPPVKKSAHNMIEKRYRNKLNDKIEELKSSVPSLKKLSSVGLADDDNEDDLDGLTPAHKTNKATVLSKATEYIRHLEKRNKQLQDDMQSLKVEMEKMRKFAMATTARFNNGPATPDTYREDPFSASASSVAPTSTMQPQGMIPVPESMMNLHGSTNSQAHYAHQYTAYPDGPRPQAAQHPMVRMRGGQPLNKLMVGALAGLMILEGLGEREESDDTTEARGLFALPIRLLSPPRSSLLQHSGSQGGALQFLPLLKPLILLGALIYLIAPLLYMKPRQKQKALAAIRLTTVPPLASPIEVRQKAWLTAIQTVWVPQHDFFSELAALASEAVKLSARSLIGWRAYAMLTGATKEQEQARVSAWKIALDAQLTGGDADISIGRLVLTILASGTLPDTPARLMLKSLHIRVLLWEICKAGYGNWFIFDELCAKLARKYWNAARFVHQLNLNSGSKAGGKGSADPDTDVEPLPDHLAALLQIECDDVLTDSIIQRAYNLAWNRPSEADDCMDGVVEDFGISSPLDALAAWWSCHTTKKALSSSLNTITISASERTAKEIDLAIRVAPPASTAHIRALVARAVLVHADRDANIAAAMAALPLRANASAVLANAVAAAPIASDVKLALTFAKCLALLHVDATGDSPVAAAAATATLAARARAVAVVAASPFANVPWTLLSFAAGYKVLNAFAADMVATRGDAAALRGVDRLAGSLRLWIGRNEGERLALGKVRGKVVERCLAVRKEVSEGRDDEERESGYGSSED